MSKSKALRRKLTQFENAERHEAALASAQARHPSGAPPEPADRAQAEPLDSWQDYAGAWQFAANVSLTCMFAIAALVCLYLAKELVLPVVLAWAIATILLPVVDWLDRKMPRVVAVLLVTLLLLALIVILVTVLSLPFSYWIGRASELGNLIREKIKTMSEPLAFFRELAASLSQTMGESSALRVEQDANIVGGVLSVLTPAVSQTILFVGSLVFYLIYQDQIRTRSVLILPGRAARLTGIRILKDIETSMTAYFGMYTLVNIGMGIATTIVCYLAGLPNPLLWGVMAALVNYIPFLGPAITTVTLFLVGLFSFAELQQAIVAPLAIIAISTVEGHFLTPALMGARLSLNPFAVFLAIGFWTWMWGPMGAFLAVPLLLIAIVTSRHLFAQSTADLPG